MTRGAPSSAAAYSKVAAGAAAGASPSATLARLARAAAAAPPAAAAPLQSAVSATLRGLCTASTAVATAEGTQLAPFGVGAVACAGIEEEDDDTLVM